MKFANVPLEMQNPSHFLYAQNEVGWERGKKDSTMCIHNHPQLRKFGLDGTKLCTKKFQKKPWKILPGVGGKLQPLRSETFGRFEMKLHLFYYRCRKKVPQPLWC